MNNVIINRGQGGLGRQPLGQDFISGLVLYGPFPAGFSPGNNILKFGGISDAIAAGITNTHICEPGAVSSFEVLTLGATGDIYNIYFQEPVNNVLIASYKQQAGDLTTDELADHIAAEIYGNLNNGGYTASASASTVTLTARPGLGTYPDGKSISIIKNPLISTFTIGPFTPFAGGGEVSAVYETSVTMGSSPNPGDQVSIYMLEPNGNNVLLATYTETISDTSPTNLAGNIAAAINLNSNNSGGYTATNTDPSSHTAGANLYITMRPGLGIYPGAISTTSTYMTFTYVKTGVLVLGAPLVTTAGVGSDIDNWYYHINRYFTQSPNATLYVGVWDVVSFTDYTFSEVAAMQAFANGAIRQCGVYIPAVFSPAQITAIEAQVKNLISINSPMSVIIGADFSTIGGVNNLEDRSGDNSEHVSIVVGQDGNATGASLYAACGYSITQLGDILGLVSSSQVSDDIAWVATYTLSPDGIENAVPAFANGQLLSSVSTGDINAVDAQRYIFGRQFVNNSPSGTYVNDSHCCTAYTSDYAYIENNRTFDKASRQLYAAYIEQLAAPLVVNPDGTLSSSTVAFFEGLGEQALSNMAQTNPNTGRPELSGFSVTINPAQNVLATSTLVVGVKLQPVGVAREIVINLQFTVSL